MWGSKLSLNSRFYQGRKKDDAAQLEKKPTRGGKSSLVGKRLFGPQRGKSKTIGAEIPPLPPASTNTALFIIIHEIH